MRTNLKGYIGLAVFLVLVLALWWTKPTAVCDPESPKYDRFVCTQLQRD